MSREPHRPTALERKEVRHLSGIGLPQADIAAIIGISEKTLRLYYREELDEGLEEANAAVVQALLQLIKAGNTAAAIFYDKCRGGKKKAKAQPKVHKPDRLVEITTDYCVQVGRCNDAIEDYLKYEVGMPIFPNADQLIWGRARLEIKFIEYARRLEKKKQNEQS